MGSKLSYITSNFNPGSTKSVADSSGLSWEQWHHSQSRRCFVALVVFGSARLSIILFYEFPTCTLVLQLLIPIRAAIGLKSIHFQNWPLKGCKIR